MIPRTYPSTIDPVSGEAQMVVKKLTSVIGLTRWIDYIPVKYNTNETVGGTYSSAVYVDPFVTGTQAWVDHIPVYEDPAATDAWLCSDTGYIPYATAAVVAAQAVLKGPKCVLWRDPSDLSTLFQDSAGTTPVTAVGQPVGLILDKKATSQPGPELVTNGSNETALFNFGTMLNADTMARAAAPGGGFAASATSTTSASTSHRWLDSSASLLAGKTYRISGRFYVPTGGLATFKIYDAADGSWFGVSSTAKDQWVSFNVVRVAKGSNWNLGMGDNVASVVTSGQIAYWIDDLSITEITGSHFVQATPASRPTWKTDSNGCLHLEYDGIDDSQASAATVDLTGTDKITVVGAWHKASDAAQGVALELSASTAANNGAFVLSFPVGASPSVGFTSKGTVSSDNNVLTGHASPVSRVISAQGSIVADQNILRANGAQIGSSSNDQGTGNYGNYTMFVGSRAGSSLRFNGREYGFALFNTTLTATELATVEAYYRAKSRAY